MSMSFKKKSYSVENADSIAHTGVNVTVIMERFHCCRLFVLGAKLFKNGHVWYRSGILLFIMAIVSLQIQQTGLMLPAGRMNKYSY